jgi:putative heme-binding domain-containing protein
MRNCLIAASAIAAFAACLWGQGEAPDRAHNGAVLFRQECLPCHGVGARGGVRGPDLTTGNWAHGGTDADLLRTIRDGVPGTAMPANHLTDSEIQEIVGYLRTVQQPPPAATGNAARGETLFFGAQRCSACHMVNGRGGRLGPELSHAGSSRPRAYLVESIRDPNRQLTENTSFGGFYDTVVAVMPDGKTVTGVPMDEDTFTVQIMDTAERIHFLEKKALKSFRHEKRSLMPAYAAGALNDADLDDLVAYLQSLRAPSPAAPKETSHAN